jgi:hypothetical protein
MLRRVYAGERWFAREEPAIDLAEVARPRRRVAGHESDHLFCGSKFASAKRINCTHLPCSVDNVEIKIRYDGAQEDEVEWTAR